MLWMVGKWDTPKRRMIDKNTREERISQGDKFHNVGASDDIRILEINTLATKILKIAKK
jgi:hypothetical protein